MPDETYRQLPLRARDGSIKAYALVSPEDYEQLSAYRWCLAGNGYVFRTVQLHREVLGVTASDAVVDHINGDPLDNRRENLRAATRRQNSHNRTSRGVHQDRGRWRAKVKDGYRSIHLGWYDDEEKARRVVAAWKAANWPFSPEARRQHLSDDVADALKLRIPPARLTPYARFSALMMLATTTLQKQEVAAILGVVPSRITAITRGPSFDPVSP